VTSLEFSGLNLRVLIQIPELRVRIQSSELAPRSQSSERGEMYSIYHSNVIRKNEYCSQHSTSEVANRIAAHYSLRQTRAGWRGRCPFHGGQSGTSFVMSIGRTGALLVHCYAGCKFAQIWDQIRGDTGLLPERRGWNQSEVEAFAAAAHFPGRRGLTDRAVLAVLVDIARKIGRLEVGASLRRIAELAKIETPKTMSQSLRRLEAAGWITQTSRSKGTSANGMLYRSQSAEAKSLRRSCPFGVCNMLASSASRSRGPIVVTFFALAAQIVGHLNVFFIISSDEGQTVHVTKCYASRKAHVHLARARRCDGRQRPFSAAGNRAWTFATNAIRPPHRCQVYGGTAPHRVRGGVMTLHEMLSRLTGVRAHAGYYTARCPAHDDRTSSLSIRPVCNGKLLLKCFAGCGWRAVIAALDGQPWRLTIGLPSMRRLEPDNRKRAEYAVGIWREARPAPGTIVERYLKMRGISIAVPASLRFHPALKHPSGLFLSAMVAAVQADNGRIVGVHRTYMARAGGAKANVEPKKLMLGPCGGGAVRFGKAVPVIAVAEGVETALSIAQAIPGLSVWAALSTSGLKTIRLPPEVREILIGADNDSSGAGERAAYDTANRFLREDARRTVRIVLPPISGSDWNDVLNGRSGA
jgi:putative DNA primase/helicase